MPDSFGFNLVAPETGVDLDAVSSRPTLELQETGCKVLPENLVRARLIRKPPYSRNDHRHCGDRRGNEAHAWTETHVVRWWRRTLVAVLGSDRWHRRSLWIEYSFDASINRSTSE